MNKERISSQNELSRIDPGAPVSLFSGITIEYLSLKGNVFSFSSNKPASVMMIHYCRSGRIVWRTEHENYIYLSSGDFFVQMSDFSHDTEVSLPNSHYTGLTIFVDLKEFTKNPPDILKGTGITGSSLYEKLYKRDSFAPYIGNVQTDSIFHFFFEQPGALQRAYQRIKTAELLLYLYRSDTLSCRCTASADIPREQLEIIRQIHEELLNNLDKRITIEELSKLYRSDTLSCRCTASADIPREQLEIIRQIHEELLNNLDKRITIEELSKRYLMNPTTMKALFKSVYGMSIAAHMKEHRMRQAARMLKESERSIAEIALSVGYDSPSKFSTAFKEFFHMLPKEYRKKR